VGGHQGGERPGAQVLVVYPERADKAGVVLVIHDIFGMAPDAVTWPQAVGDQLAKEGFIAIVPDLLSGKGPNGGGSEAVPNVNQASWGSRKPMSFRGWTPRWLTARRCRRRMGRPESSASAGEATRASHTPLRNPGSMVRRVLRPGARQRKPYVVDPAELGKLKVPVIGFYGGTDMRVTSTVEPTVAAAKQLGKSYEPHVFDGAGHGFLRNQSTEPNYKAASRRGR